jgi:hypothetical protein
LCVCVSIEHQLGKMDNAAACDGTFENERAKRVVFRYPRAARSKSRSNVSG